MKLSQRKLKRIIKEEVAKALNEDIFDELDAELKKPEKKVKCPNKTNAKPVAIKAIKEARALPPSRSQERKLKEADIYNAACISQQQTGKSKGQKAHKVIFKNGIYVIVLESELQ